MRRSELLILIAILLLGAALRGIYLSEIARSPDFKYPGIDAHYHDYWARALATGEWSPPTPYADPMIRSKPFFRSPGYPYFLAMVYKLTGGSYLAARIAQMLLGLIGVLIAFVIGRRWCGRKVALIFAGLMSVYWVFIYYEGELLEPALLNVLALLLIYSLGLWTEKITWKRSLATGILIGLFALVRQNILPFGVVALGWAYWVVRTKKEMQSFRTACIGLILGCALMILPATIRNYVVGHDLVLISSSGGINLYIGNNPSADGYTSVAPGFPRWTSHDYPRIVEGLGDSVGRELEYSEASRLFTQAAIQWVRANPGRALRLTAKKALLFWGPVEVGNEKEDEFERQSYRVLRSIPGSFATVLSLALVGTLLCFTGAGSPRSSRHAKEASRAQYQVFILVLLLIVTYFLTYLPFFVAGRFRVPIIPCLLLLAAYGVSRAMDFIACRDFRALFYWACFFFVGYGIAAANFAHYRPAIDRWYFARGTAYDTAGNEELAEREYRRALEANPLYADAHAGLATVLREQGKTDEAIDEFREALRLNPTIAQAHSNLAVALYFKGRYAEAWDEVHLAKKYGITPPAGFLEALSKKMLEPPE